MDAARRLGGGDALHAVHPRLVLEPGVSAVALDQRNRLPDTTHPGLGKIGDRDAPSPSLGVPGIHTQQLGREQSSFLAAGARPHFEYNVSSVVGIWGQQEELECALPFGQLAGQALHLVLGHRPELGVALAGDQLAGATLLVKELLVRLVRRDHGIDLGQLLGNLEQAFAIGEHLGARLLVFQVLPAADYLVETLEHAVHGASLPFTGSSGKRYDASENTTSRETLSRPALVAQFGRRLTPFRACRNGGGTVPPFRRSR